MKLTMSRLLCAALVAAGAGAGPVWAAPGGKAAVAPRARAAFPSLNLPAHEVAGERAVQALGAKLADVAAWYGHSADELRQHLLADKRMRLDRRGRVFFVEEQDQPLAAAAASGAEPSPGLLDGTLAPLEQTFSLHSRPGAKKTIYLNFKGAVITGTAWNATSPSITAQPFDLDGLPYSFSTAELQRIQYIWQRVAEDYAPFDVDVTTEAVPQELLSRSGDEDEIFGTTVVITRSTGVYNCSCGGVAYAGSFDDTSDYYKPALVFFNTLGSGNEKRVAEAISHEAGHNLGLSHKGTWNPSTAYYAGHGTGATAWAPIMGVGDYKPVSQWSRGEYRYASNLLDELATMQWYGLPLRADDHGNLAGTATWLAGSAGAGGVSTARALGVIESAEDVDVFAFAAAAGSASFTLSPATRAPNLDALITLRDAAGTVLASANPVDALNATLTFSLPAQGTYHLSVQGAGKGDPYTNGYSSYGSLGQYALTASWPTAAGLPPTAAVAASTLAGTLPLTVDFSGLGSTDADGSLIAWDWSFEDGGSAAGTTASYTFNTAGTWAATLRVTDDSGLSASRSVLITVEEPLPPEEMSVESVDMSLGTTTAQAAAYARVKVSDGRRRPVAGALVAGTWRADGSATSATATTDARGQASFAAPAAAGAAARLAFTVNKVERAGYRYAPKRNRETRDLMLR